MCADENKGHFQGGSHGACIGIWHRMVMIVAFAQVWRMRRGLTFRQELCVRSVGGSIERNINIEGSIEGSFGGGFLEDDADVPLVGRVRARNA